MNNLISDEQWEKPYFEKTTMLSDEWQWRRYRDGSGSLINSNGKSYFSYDLATVPNGVEYRKNKEDGWDTFHGTFAEFKDFAEKIVKEKYCSHEKTTSVKEQKEKALSSKNKEVIKTPSKDKRLER